MMYKITSQPQFFWVKMLTTIKLLVTTFSQDAASLNVIINLLDSFQLGCVAWGKILSVKVLYEAGTSNGAVLLIEAELWGICVQPKASSV